MARRGGGRAVRMASIAHRTDAELGGRSSVLARQRRDHEELDRLLARLRSTTGPEQDEVLTRIARLVFPHAFAEEAVLWPAVRSALPDGEALTLRIEQEHQEVNELWAALERTPRTDLLDRLVQVLQADVRDEEDVLLPRLRQALDGARLRRLGIAPPAGPPHVCWPAWPGPSSTPRRSPAASAPAPTAEGGRSRAGGRLASRGRDDQDATFSATVTATSSTAGTAKARIHPRCQLATAGGSPSRRSSAAHSSSRVCLRRPDRSRHSFMPMSMKSLHSTGGVTDPALRSWSSDGSGAGGRRRPGRPPWAFAHPRRLPVAAKLECRPPSTTICSASSVSTPRTSSHGTCTVRNGLTRTTPSRVVVTRGRRKTSTTSAVRTNPQRNAATATSRCPRWTSSTTTHPARPTTKTSPMTPRTSSDVDR